MEFSGLAWHMLRGGRPLERRLSQEEAAQAILGVDEEYDRNQPEVITFYNDTRDSEQYIWVHDIVQVVSTIYKDIDLHIIGSVLEVLGGVDFRKEVYVTANRYRSDQSLVADHKLDLAVYFDVMAAVSAAIRVRGSETFRPFFFLFRFNSFQFNLFTSNKRIIVHVLDVFLTQHPPEDL